MDARYDMASSDQREQNEKDSEQLYRVVGEEEQEYDEVPPADVNPMVGILNIIASSGPAAVVVFLYVEKINSSGDGEREGSDEEGNEMQAESQPLVVVHYSGGSVGVVHVLEVSIVVAMALSVSIVLLFNDVMGHLFCVVWGRN